MKPNGYYIGSSYIGFIPSLGKYWQFESETAYIEFLKDRGELWAKQKKSVQTAEINIVAVGYVES